MRSVAILVCALAGVHAQPDNGCSTEIVALASTASLDADAICALLRNYEGCISRIIDVDERGNLESDLQVKQQQHPGCVDAPLTAAVRTSRDVLEFEGADFTFHRTRRQSLNLYELRDQVASFTGAIATTSASIDAVESTIGVMAADGGGRQSTIASVSTAVTTLQQALSNSVALLEAQISSGASLQAAAASTAAAAASANNYACVPGLEYDAGNGVCRYVNFTCDTFHEHYQSARETRTSDRVCASKLQCNSSAWEVTPGNRFTNRICRAITNCTANDLFTESEATPTSDAVCIRMPGLSESSAVSDCRALLNVEGANSGYYWITFGNVAIQTWCDMTTDGGGWTAVARGNGRERACWTTADDCRINLLGAAGARSGYTGLTALHKGATSRLSDAKINSLTYSMIRYQGTDTVRTNVYFRGKNNNVGGCTYRHWVMATGHCNCASNYVDMRGRRCGNNYSTHRGAGDWPHGGGGMHTAHTGGWWYIKLGYAHSPYCSGTGHRDTNCDVMLWVR